MVLFFLFLIMGSCDDEKPPEPPCYDFFGRPCEWSNYRTFMDANVTFSPDGQHVAIAKEGSPLGDGLLIGDSLGNNLRRVIGAFADGFGTISWSPDNRWLVFDYAENLFTVNITGDSGGIFLDSSRYRFPTWTTEWIYYSKMQSDSKGDRGLWRIRPDKSEKQFLDSRIGYSMRLQDSSFIGSYFDNTTLGNPLTRFYPFGNGVTDTLLASTTLGITYPRLSPNGNYIAFQGQGGPNGGAIGYRSNVWVVTIDSQDAAQLTVFGGEIPTWSRDSQWIFFTDTDSTGRVWRMRIDGTERQQFTF